MTILTITRAVTDEVAVNRPATVVGNTSPEVQKLLRLANKVGKSLMKGVVWSDLRKEQTFTALATETQTGILPSDFDRFVPETFWDRDNEILVSGPISASEWQNLKAIGYSGPQKKFILRGGVVLTIPVFGGGETLAFEYVSNLWCETSGGTGLTAWAADTDVGVLDEELLTRAMIYAYLDGEGQPSDKAWQDFEDYANTLLQNDQPSSGIMVSADIFGGGRHYTGVPATNINPLLLV